MVIDLTYLRNMAAGNTKLMLEMIEIFESQTKEFSQEMDQLLKDKEYELLGKLAHKAKSSISIMGMDDLAKDLKNLENLAKAGAEVDKYPEFIHKFKSETTEAIKELLEISENIDLYI